MSTRALTQPRSSRLECPSYDTLAMRHWRKDNNNETWSRCLDMNCIGFVLFSYF